MTDYAPDDAELTTTAAVRLDNSHERSGSAQADAAAASIRSTARLTGENGRHTGGSANASGGEYATAECAIQTSTPGVLSAPRASLLGGEGQGGDALPAAESEPALPAARPSGPPAGRGRAVNQTELSQIFGVTDVTLWEWQKLDGFPILQRGGRGQSNWYDTADVIAWKIDHEVRKASGPESQKDRLARLQADRIQIELDELRGKSIPADEIEPTWANIMVAIKQGLLPLGLRLSPVLETTPGVDAKRELIDEEVHDVLKKLSAYGGESPAGPGPQGDGVPGAAAADPARQVG